VGDTDKEKKVKILFVISSVPFSSDFNTIYNLSKVLVEKAEIEFFLTGNGVYKRGAFVGGEQFNL